MLIPVKDLRGYWRVRPAGVVHVGAHLAEELGDYEAFGFGPVVWIEAQPRLADELKSRVKPPSQVIQALVWDKSGEEKVLKLTNNSQSSSIFDLGTHQVDHPDVKVVDELTLRTVRLDEILPTDMSHNFLNIDIQGAEYQALKSLGWLLGKFDYVYLEVNSAQVYKEIKQIDDLDLLLADEGFIRVATIWTPASWGDALYIRRSLAETLFKSKFGLAFRVIWFQVITKLRR